MNTAIYDAFAPLVTAFAAGYSPELPVSYPGLSFESPSEGPWLELRVFRNDGEEYGVSNFGPAVERGFFRVIVCGRPGEGINEATNIAEALIDAIPKGTELGPARIERTPSMTGPITDDAVVMHTVTFRYIATRAPDTVRVQVLIGENPGSHFEAV